MRVFTGLGAVTRPPRRAVATVGVFDGVHVGHQQLIRSTIRLARRVNGTSVVITFDPDPETVLHPGASAAALMPLAARLSALSTLGADWVWVLPFSKRFARMGAEQFIRDFLIRRLRTHTLIVGDAFAFGRGRRGNMEILQRLGLALGMRVIPVEPITRAGRPVSSSRIRACVRQGDLRQARRLLGRAPGLYGTVVRGAGRGRRLGCPTANLRLIPFYQYNQPLTRRDLQVGGYERYRNAQVIHLAGVVQDRRAYDRLLDIVKRRSEERRVGKECRSRWSPYH